MLHLLRYCLLFLLPHPFLGAQDALRFEQLSAEEGFSQSVVYQLAQDRSGNLWAATEEGLIRHNSQRSYHYRPGKGLPAGFGDRVRSVQVSENGRVWIGSEQGLARYDGRTDTFQAVASGPSLISTLVCAGNGTLYIGAFNGLWRYREERMERIADLRSIEAILPPLPGATTLFFGGTGGLFALDVSGGNWASLPFSPAVSALARRPGRPDQLLVGTRNAGLFLVDERGTTEARPLPLSRTPVSDLLELPDGHLFVATDGQGLYELDGSLAVVNNFRYDVDRPDSPSSDGIYDLLLDKDGLLFLATYGGGLNKLNPYTNVFDRFTHEPNSRNSLAHPFTRSLLEDRDGRVWFGTKNGISIWSPTNGSWRHLLAAEPGRNGPRIIMSLREDGDRVWAVTFKHGLFRIDRRSLSVTSVPLSEAGKEQGRLYSATLDEGGNLWVGGINRRVVRRTPGGALTYYPIQQVKHLIPAAGGGVWAAGRNGLARLDSGSVRTIEELSPERISGGYSTFNMVAERANGELLIATNGAGLLTYDPVSGKVGYVNAALGMPSDIVQSVLPDDRGDVWAGTTRGLARITFSSPDTLVRVYTQADGLAGTEMNYGSALRQRDGHLLVGGVNGVTRFLPGNVRSPATPRIHLEALEVNNERQLPGRGVLADGPLDSLDQVRLRYDRNTLRLEFAGVSHVAAGQLLYRWRMDGLTQEWSPPSSSGQLPLSGLEPGEYRLRLQASINGTEWGPVRELTIRVLPPWWWTKTAYFVYLLLFLLLGYALYRISRILITRRNAQHQIAFFNNITHELKTPLAILLANLEDVDREGAENTTRATGQVKATVNRLNSLFEQLLNFHKASSGSKSRHVAAIPLQSHLNDLLSSFRPLLRERELELRLDAAAAGELFHYDRDIFDKILFNLISNAVKYSRPGGEIEVSVATVGQELRLNVRDNGIGIPADQQKYILREYYRARNVINSQLPGTGLGLMMVKSMVDKEGGSIRFTSEEGVGTTFYVRLTDRQADMNIAPAAAPATPTNASASAPPSAHILLVEDNDDLRRQLATRLGRLFKVTTATNGREGLALAAEHFPDIIVTDLIMPEMDGMEMSRAIRNDIQLDHIPIVMLTVLHNSDQKLESIESGVTEYLEKPVNFDLLVAKLTNLLNWRKRMRERYARQGEIAQAATHQDDREGQFLQKLETYTLAEIANDSLSVQDLCRELGMSRTSLYMKLKQLVDLSPQDFIIHTRLRYARRQLTETEDAIKEIAYRCGFANPKYFSTAFRKQFGESPSGFRKGLRGG